MARPQLVVRTIVQLSQESEAFMWVVILVFVPIALLVLYRFVTYLLQSPEIKIYILNLLAAFGISVVRYFTNQTEIYWLLAALYLVANTVFYVSIFKKLPNNPADKFKANEMFIVISILVFILADAIVSTAKYYLWP